jgi:hypothetical protein
MTDIKNHLYSTVKQDTGRHECITSGLCLYGVMELAPFVPVVVRKLFCFKDSESAGDFPASFEADGMLPAAIDTDDSGASHIASDQVPNEMGTHR